MLLKGCSGRWLIKVEVEVRVVRTLVCLAFFIQIVSWRLSQLCPEQQHALFHGMNLPLSAFHFLNSIVCISPGIYAIGLGLGCFPDWACYE